MKRWVGLVVLLALLSTVAIALLQMRGDGKLAPVADAPGFGHVHGLGVDPADDALYAATHHGLYRITEGDAELVANRYQDTMAFTVIGPNHFLASGHPDFREELPPLLGLLESKDAGGTWMKRSLLGDADFHVLREVRSEVWGYDATSSRLLISRDRESWDRRGDQLVLTDFVVSPVDDATVLGANGKSLLLSADGGETWDRLDEPAGPALLVWDRAGSVVITTDGDTYVASGLATQWTKTGSIGAQPTAVHRAGETLYAATQDMILSSTDDGKNWRPYYPR